MSKPGKQLDQPGTPGARAPLRGASKGQVQSGSKLQLGQAKVHGQEHQPQAASDERLFGLPPVVNANTRLLILVP